MDRLLIVLDTCWGVTAEMAPWLLLGFAVAGAMHVLVAPSFVERHLGGRGLGQVIKATFFGIPLPLCSCGVIPVTAGLIRHGAGRGASSAFLLATPQTGVDSIAATYALLGPVFAVVRPFVALVTGIVGGVAVDAGARADAVAKVAAEGGCCAAEAPFASGHRLRPALRYGLVTLPGDIAWSLIVGVVITGVITAFVGAGELEPYLGGGLVAMLLMIVVGTPLYVCATGSIPLALGFMHMGASPGAALAFLIAGPATNATTIAVTWNLIGRRATVIYLLVVLASALGAGLLLDQFAVNVPMGVLHGHEHAAPLTVVEHLFGLALLTVLAAGLLNRHGWLPAKKPEAADAAALDAGAQTLELEVTGMTCSQCAGTVARALRETANVAAADVDLAHHRATVSGRDLDRDQLVAAIRSVGFDAA